MTAQWLSQPDKSTTASQPGAASRPAPTSNGPARQLYTGAELAPYSGRPGAMDAFALPSRMQNTLHWRDGRTAPHTASSALPANPAATTPAATPQPQAAHRARKSKGA